MKISIIIPVYNEEKTISLVIQKIQSMHLAENLSKEICIVNDGSNDQTAAILSQFNDDLSVLIFHHEKNQGKTAALKTAMAHATGDIFVIQDADLEYDPVNIPQLIEPVLAKKTTVVYGSRFKGQIDGMPLINRFANVLTNVTFNVLFGTSLTDVNTGYKVFTKDTINNISIHSNDFTFETEITAKLTKKGIKILEVPITYKARLKREGKKMSWWKAMKMYCGIFQYRMGGKKNQ